jgi:DNA polymerase-3 subunit delta'
MPRSSSATERNSAEPAVAGSSPRPELRGLSGIAGQDRVVSVLLSAMRHGRPHHAYLFDGPEGIGKATCARALFAALNCLEPPSLGGACGQCSSCIKLAAGTHPDLIVFDMTLSGLAEEAERVIRRLQFPPFEGRVQMVLFDPADQFTAPTAATAANRLLKTLEEPRPATHFVLITTAASSLLSTIRSRCQRLRFAPLPDAALAATLQAQHGASEEDARAVLKLAQGSFGRAVRYLEDKEQLGRCEQSAADLYTAAREGRATRMVEVASDVGADREHTLEALELLWLRLHDDLRGHVDGHGPEPLGFYRHCERLLGGLRAVRAAQQAVRGYTGAPLALERMLRHLHSALPSSPASAAARGTSP